MFSTGRTIKKVLAVLERLPKLATVGRGGTESGWELDPFPRKFPVNRSLTSGIGHDELGSNCRVSAWLRLYPVKKMLHRGNLGE